MTKGGGAAEPEWGGSCGRKRVYEAPRILGILLLSSLSPIPSLRLGLYCGVFKAMGLYPGVSRATGRLMWTAVFLLLLQEVQMRGETTSTFGDVVFVSA